MTSAATAAQRSPELQPSESRNCMPGANPEHAAIAAPEGQACYAGLHTALGEVIGRAVYQAVRQGATEWIAAQRAGRLG